MNLLEGFVHEQIYVDFGSEPLYGYDQANVSYPCHFATVNLQLMATNGLALIADRIRKNLGFVPMHPMDEYTEDFCENDGWYLFYIGLNDYCESKLDNAIEFVVVNSDSPDNEEIYTIDLSEEEQKVLYNRLDEQCRKYLGKGCEELLAEARAEMLAEARKLLREEARKELEEDGT